MKKYVQNIGHDLPSAIVLFLISLPLCLGIALGSGAPLFSGIIAGIVGGVVIGALSGSQLSVSGPAAGLTVIVATAILKLQVYEAFLLAVVLAGIIQLLFGFVRAGVIGDYVPNSVIKGMLAAIGLILILKQIPHLMGYDVDFEGDESFAQGNTKNTFSAIFQAIEFITPTAALIGGISLLILIGWESKFMKSTKIGGAVPGALIAVVAGILVNEFCKMANATYALETKHLVSLPVANDMVSFFSLFSWPDIKFLNNPDVWSTAAKIALVASLETLLSIEAVDKLDPLRRVTPPNRELKAQGIGNIISGLIGGLPVTSVVVRSSANVTAGAKTRVSAIMQGFLLLLCVMFIPFLLNKIPLSALAAVLIFTGYRLAKISLFKEFFQKGWDQFVPFVVTIVAILLTDLLIGVIVGIIVGLFYMVRNNFRSAIFAMNDNNNYLIRLRKDVSFLNKPIIKKKMEDVPKNAFVIIDTSRADFIDKDIIEEINNFLCHTHLKNIQVEIKKNIHNPLHLLINEPPILLK